MEVEGFEVEELLQEAVVIEILDKSINLFWNTPRNTMLSALTSSTRQVLSIINSTSLHSQAFFQPCAKTDRFCVFLMRDHVPFITLLFTGPCRQLDPSST